MSAFVVADQTIDRVVNYLHQMDRHDLKPLFCLGYTLQGHGDDPGDDDRETIGRDMHLLNIDAVRQRYGDADSSGMIPPAYVHTPGAAAPAVSVFKALGCWLYQCDEGTVCEAPLYKAMDHIRAALAMSIVWEMPEYEAAPWG